MILEKFSGSVKEMETEPEKYTDSCVSRELHFESDPSNAGLRHSEASLTKEQTYTSDNNINCRYLSSLVCGVTHPMQDGPPDKGT